MQVGFLSKKAARVGVFFDTDAPELDASRNIFQYLELTEREIFASSGRNCGSALRFSDIKMYRGELSL